MSQVDYLHNVLAIDTNGYDFIKGIDSSALPRKAWFLNGNVAAPNFIGTINTMPLSFKANSSERITINAVGNVGINTNSPTKLYVDGGVRFHNLPVGTGNTLGINANGDVQRSTAIFGRSQEPIKK